MRCPCKILLLLALAPLAGRAQQGLENMVFTAGTTWTAAGGQEWAYIVWKATDPGLFDGKHFAVYAKAGDASATNAFALKAVVGWQTSPAWIAPLLDRSVALGSNTNELNSALDHLFQTISNTSILSLPEKLSAVMRGTPADDREKVDNLLLLAGLYPGVNLAFGRGYADPIAASGKTTYEVREFDTGRNADVAVVGRVTVEAGHPTVLPPPDNPVAVPELAGHSAKGHLNAKLRWATPDELRRWSLLNWGFDVFRMTKSFAQLNNYHVTPPTPGTLLSLLGNPSVQRVNHAPVMCNKDFSAGVGPGQVGDLTGDPETYFLADDNGAYDPGGQGFKNGDQFYYFVAARDILRRIGNVSGGTLVTICSGLPPLVPQNVRVANETSFTNGFRKQVLKITWDQNTDSTNDTANNVYTTNYYVYRWTDPHEIPALSGNPLTNRIAGPIPHTPGQKSLSVLDDGTGAPQIAVNAGQTFWYTVRAEDNGACAANLSGNSAPAWGVLRNWLNTNAPTATAQIQCIQPVVIFSDFSYEYVGPSGDTNLAWFRLICSRQDSGIEWAEFYVGNTNASSLVGGRTYFLSDDPVSVDCGLDSSVQTNVFYCRVGDVAGRVSDFATTGTVAGHPTDLLKRVPFDAHTEVTQTTLGGACGCHSPNVPGSVTVAPIMISMQLPPGTREWRLYRQVDDGPMTLLKQDSINITNWVQQVTIADDALPANAAEVCYWGQCFDENGNGGPLTLFFCLHVAGMNALPRPILLPLTRTGTDLSPGMKIQWFCAPAGVERFELSIGCSAPSPITGASVPLSVNLAPVRNIVPVTAAGVTNTSFNVSVFRTMRIASGFGSNGLYSLTISIQPGAEYIVYVKAMDAREHVGPPSNVGGFKWSPAPLPLGDHVPWPARALPRTTNFFAAGIQAVVLEPVVFPGIGVRIGQLPYNPTNGFPTRPYSLTYWNQLTFYTNTITGSNIFPVVMYRTQIPNARFPTPSGDVIQVTPLMEKIATASTSAWVPPVPCTNIWDPFVVVGLIRSDVVALYLVDTQPILYGATYRYFLMRFRPNHEIDEVIPTNDVEVPWP